MQQHLLKPMPHSSAEQGTPGWGLISSNKRLLPPPVFLTGLWTSRGASVQELACCLPLSRLSHTPANYIANVSTLIDTYQALVTPTPGTRVPSGTDGDGSPS